MQQKKKEKVFGLICKKSEKQNCSINLFRNFKLINLNQVWAFTLNTLLTIHNVKPKGYKKYLLDD